MNKISSVLLDLDGTLIDSLLDITDSINYMRKDLKLTNLPAHIIKGFIGKGIDNLINKSLYDYPYSKNNILDKKYTFNKAKDLFSRYYCNCNGSKTVLYPGVLEGLNKLKQEQLSLSIVTNKPTKPTLQILQKLNLSHLFSYVICGDTCQHCKPEPDQLLFACKQLNTTPEKTIMIGDSSNDVMAARAANVAAVLVLPYGYHNKKIF
ncbi:phosphoglycolate phosphatase [Candidatus Kinetoplastibacterium crithidii (ex Angomonas deanei ATCC 30255)]|uniref:HAD-IA family hydrolase n=1 Tax=Candidatus Kinetoplastidibacterium crithidiae TaxID=33056 RepID=UPI0002A1169F|nr:HAD-IA family hydrolase [Candidatus Kinetoplastibacterium crithidii]AFZ83068.1 phosphoglycolate phosphatase [Candidatus Kinetoplastibacterium crithidii (ex Angomonas deanei ATCC 30255)]